MNSAWFFSSTVRHATDMHRQVRRLFNEQRDILELTAFQNLSLAIHSFGKKLAATTDKAALQKEMAALEKIANENLKPYPNGGIREQVRDILVAITVILSFTTFFLQLTKIPTGSMQPTLYGITHEDLRDRPDFQIPGFFGRMKDYWVHGYSYVHIVAPNDGRLDEVYPPRIVFPFVKRQRLVFNGENFTVWLPPEDLVKRADLRPGHFYSKGEDIVKIKVVAGDHLFVDRFTYNFRQPKRGEIIVFKTKGIENLSQQDVLYIKRLVGLPNEKVQIGNDQHLIINDRRLDASTRHFEHLYSFELAPENNLYKGHVNELAARQKYQYRGLAPLFPDETAELTVGPNHYLAMGDNTLHSLDSRSWGDLPQKNVIGRCWFVYWPFTDRFGWGYR